MITNINQIKMCCSQVHTIQNGMSPEAFSSSKVKGGKGRGGDTPHFYWKPMLKEHKSPQLTTTFMALAFSINCTVTVYHMFEMDYFIPEIFFFFSEDD